MGKDTRDRSATVVYKPAAPTMTGGRFVTRALAQKKFNIHRSKEYNVHTHVRTYIQYTSPGRGAGLEKGNN